jgi:hypothetical protein
MRGAGSYLRLLALTLRALRYGVSLIERVGQLLTQKYGLVAYLVERNPLCVLIGDMAQIPFDEVVYVFPVKVDARGLDIDRRVIDHRFE